MTHLMARTSTLPYFAIAQCGKPVRTKTLVDYKPTCPDCERVEAIKDREADLDVVLAGKQMDKEISA